MADEHLPGVSAPSGVRERELKRAPSQPARVGYRGCCGRDQAGGTPGWGGRKSLVGTRSGKEPAVEESGKNLQQGESQCTAPGQERLWACGRLWL